MGGQWCVSLTALAQSKLNSARAVAPNVDLLYKALCMRLSHDPFRDAAKVGPDVYALVIEADSVISIQINVLYMVGNEKVLIKNVKFL